MDFTYLWLWVIFLIQCALWFNYVSQNKMWQINVTNYSVWFIENCCLLSKRLNYMLHEEVNGYGTISHSPINNCSYVSSITLVVSFKNNTSVQLHLYVKQFYETYLSVSYWGSVIGFKLLTCRVLNKMKSKVLIFT